MDALLGYGVAIILSLMSVGTFIKWSDTGAKNILAAAVAGQNIVFDKATSQYVQDYSTTIAETATASTPVTITTSMLINTGYLPSGFSSTNAYGQTWEAQVLQPSTDELETMVITTGGTAISDEIQLVRIAAQVGAEGGFIPYTDQGGDSAMSSSYAMGSYGGWKQSMTGFTNPGSGHLASLLAYTGTAANSNYLYRVAVSGESQLNAMQTDLSMEDTSGSKHNINDIDEVNAETVTTTGNITADGTITADGAISTASTLTATGAIKTSSSVTASGSISSGGNISASGSITSGSTITASGRVTSDEYLIAEGSATAGGSCTDSTIGNSGTQPLFCVNGTWTALASFTPQVYTTADTSSGTIGPYNWCFPMMTTIQETSAYGTWGVELIANYGTGDRYFEAYNSKSGGEITYVCF